MRSRRSCLLLGLVVLVGIGLAGCTGGLFTTPKAVFTASPTKEVVPFTANFDATLSYDPNGTIASYVWNFGDGGSGIGPIVAHSFNQNGTYTVLLTVVDEHGKTSSSTLTVEALDPPPVPGFTWSPKSQLNGEYIAGASEWLTFDASTSTDDGSIVAYDWAFGDNTTGTGQTVKHRFVWPGTYAVTLTVTDNDGSKASRTEEINVIGGAPCYIDYPTQGSGN